MVSFVFGAAVEELAPACAQRMVYHAFPMLQVSPRSRPSTRVLPAAHRPPEGVTALVVLACASLALCPERSQAGQEIRYEVIADAEATNLQVEMWVPPGSGSSFTVDPDAVPFVDNVRFSQADHRSPLHDVGGTWNLSICRRAGCRIRYLFHLRTAARALDEPDTAAARGGAIVAPAGTWLLRPSRVPDGGLHAQLHVTTSAPLTFVTGLPRVAGQDLPSVVRELGVSIAKGSVTFDNRAPLAAIRRGIVGPLTSAAADE